MGGGMGDADVEERVLSGGRESRSGCRRGEGGGGGREERALAGASRQAVRDEERRAQSGWGPLRSAQRARSTEREGGVELQPPQQQTTPSSAGQRPGGRRAGGRSGG